MVFERGLNPIAPFQDGVKRLWRGLQEAFQLFIPAKMALGA